MEGARFFADYPGRDNSMQHLACFAGGMFAYGAKFAEDQNEDLQVFIHTHEFKIFHDFL